MDETPTKMYMPDNKTIEVKGSKSVEIANTGHLKTRFTSVLKIAAGGTRLPTYVVLRKLVKPLNVHASSTIVMFNKCLIILIFTDVFRLSVQFKWIADSRQNQIQGKIFLITYLEINNKIKNRPIFVLIIYLKFNKNG